MTSPLPRASLPPPTPSRASRLLEQSTLHALNLRLASILSANGELSSLTSSSSSALEQEVAALRTAIRDREKAAEVLVERLVKERDEAVGEGKERMKEGKEWKKRVKEVEDELAGKLEEVKKVGELEGKLEEMRKRERKREEELEGWKKKCKEAEEREKKSKAQIELLGGALEEQKTMFEGLLLTRENQIKDGEFRLKQVKGELAAAETKREKMIAEMGALRKEFETKLLNGISKALAEQESAYEKEKEEVMNELQLVHHEQIVLYQKDLETIGHEKAHFEADVGRLETLVSTTQKELKETKEKFKQVELSLSESALALKSELEKQTRENIRTAKMFQKMKETYRQKEIEFDQLMDLKIMLAQELKMYNDLLVREETRLGIITPSKKRKLNSATSLGSGVDTSGSPFILSGVNLDNHCITIRNQTLEEIDTAGWKLTNSKNDPTFALPSYKIASGKSFQVWAVKKDQVDLSGAASDVNIVMDVDAAIFFDLSEGDEVKLLNGHNKIMHTINIHAFTDPPSELSTSSTCHIM